MSDAAVPEPDGAGPHGPLSGLRVLDATSGIAGAYCTKLLADAGADVVLVEPPGGHPLRRRTATGRELAEGEDGALFQYLSGGKRSVPDAADLPDLADVVIVDEGATVAPRADLVVVTLTGFGLEGPWARRPASDLTLQALSSSIASRGEVTTPPVAAGGEQIEWTAGAVGAVAALMALRQRERTGLGDRIVVSKLEVAVTIFNGFRSIAGQLAPPPARPWRGLEVPSIEQTADGWVGLCTLSADQWKAFCEMIGRPDWISDPVVSWTDNRRVRSAELRPLVAQWSTQHSTGEILSEAALRHIPSAPVGNGETTPQIGHLVERGVFERQPGARFPRPRIPYLLGGRPGPPARPAPPRPVPGGPSPAWREHQAARPATSGAAGGPLSGIRVFDFTSFWAGPLVGQILGQFGADVLKVESVQRPDGTRMATSYGIAGEGRWEKAPLFHGVNTDKRGVTLDLTSEEGRRLAGRLLERCDILVENWSPRVLERFGLLDDLPGHLIVLRCPAWGTTGPWRDAPGFAQNMEQASGLAWVTGFPDGPPIVPRGPCDPNGGLHATFAALLALAERGRTGRGQVVEVPLIESALAVAAEQFVEYGAYGDLLGRLGNRSRRHAPSNLYRCRGEDEWVAVSVTADAEWRLLARALGDPAWAGDPALASAEGRMAASDTLDAHLGAWCATRTPQEAADILWSAGVPAAAVVAPHDVVQLAGLERYFQPVAHPVAGTVRVPVFPAAFASGAAARPSRPAPTLGQHTREVLSELAGCTDAELDDLEARHVIGTRPLSAR